jgi:hypothetical protein
MLASPSAIHTQTRIRVVSRRVMTTAQLLNAPEARTAEPESGARVSLRQPVSESGFIDAAWWPRSRDLTVELPGLLDVLWTAGRDVMHVAYRLAAWDHAPRRVRVAGRMVRLGGFNTGDPLTVELVDVWGRERIDVLVIDPGTDPVVAQRALLLASVADSPYRPSEILARAVDPATDDQGTHR